MDQSLEKQDADAAATETNIYVTPAAPAARPPMPEFKPVLRPASSAPASAPTPVERIETMKETETVSTQTPPIDVATTKTSTHKTINWGGVIKGVAIIGAVVLVGVAGAAAAGYLAHAALMTGGVSPIAASIWQLTSPIVNGLTYAGHFLTGFVPSILPSIGHFFTSAVAPLHLGSAAAPSAAALTAHQAGATVAAAKLLGAGASVAVAVPVAAHAIQGLDIAHNVTTTQTVVDHTHLTTAAPSVESMHESGLFSNLLSAKSGLFHNVATSETSHVAGNEAAHNAHEAFEVGHQGHAAHEAHEAHEAAISGVPTENYRKRSWASRTQGAPTENISTFAEKVRASQPDAVAAVKPRGETFIEALNDDRAKLDAALASPAI